MKACPVCGGEVPSRSGKHGRPPVACPGSCRQAHSAALARERCIRFQQRHPAYYVDYSRRYRQDNAPAVRESERARAAAHRDELTAYQRRYQYARRFGSSLVPLAEAIYQLKKEATSHADR